MHGSYRSRWVKPYRDSGYHVLRILTIPNDGGKRWNERDKASNQVGQRAFEDTSPILGVGESVRVLAVFPCLPAKSLQTGRWLFNVGRAEQRCGLRVIMIRSVAGFAESKCSPRALSGGWRDKRCSS